MSETGKRLIKSATGARDNLAELLAKAEARYQAMTPEQKAAHDKAQRESWARANVATGDPRFD